MQRLFKDHFQAVGYAIPHSWTCQENPNRYHLVSVVPEIL